MWRSLRRGDGAMTAPVPVDGPLVGLKYAAVVTVDGELRFCGTTARSRHSRCYDTESVATCQQGHDHRPPAWSCTCGFYAHTTDRELEQSWGDLRRPYWARLVVELSGRVVEHERGWRASRQVVLEASWEDRCETCTERPADGFGPSDRLPGAVVPRCRHCAGDQWMPVNVVAGRLGTDVRLVPARPATLSPELGASVARSTWLRQILTRGSVLLGAGVIVTGLVALSGETATSDRQPDLLASLRPHVDVWSPEATARGIAEHVDGAGRRAIVIADTGDPTLATIEEPVDEATSTAGAGPGVLGPIHDAAADLRARRPVVSAIALFEGVPDVPPPAGPGPGEGASPGTAVGPGSTARCRIVLVRPTVPAMNWSVLASPAGTLEDCVRDATRSRAPHVVTPSEAQ